MGEHRIAFEQYRRMKRRGRVLVQRSAPLAIAPMHHVEDEQGRRYLPLEIVSWPPSRSAPQLPLLRFIPLRAEE